MSSSDLSNDPRDVEDVLASIRKLVAAEAEELQTDKAQDPLVLNTAVDTPVDDEMLVLQSAQKIEPDVPEKLVLEPQQSADISPAPLKLGPEATVADQASEQEEVSPTAPFHDEVALRALVSEILREELQGELGNRITKNVRILIRREIEQALKANQ